MEILSKCDGKKCGQGRLIAYGFYICPHNNLAVRFPHLVQEWHPDNPGKPEDYPAGSDKKVKWKCRNDPCGCHVWIAPIRSRSSKSYGCPYCANQKRCPHNRP